VSNDISNYYPDTVASESWDITITGKRKFLNFNLQEIWRYRDLLLLFVKRDIITVYKQTILGPLWFVIQPILTTVVFVIVFGNLAGISTDGVPQVLFYLAGLTIWNYFSETLTVTSKTFTENAGIFGKVYFPRLIIPLSKVISGLVKYAIQFAFFICIWLYYLITTDSVHPNAWILLLPFLLLLMAMLGLGFGIIITSLTTKYRDLSFLITFGIQLLMYATPVIFPMSVVPEKYRLYAWLNPLSSVMEAFKYAFMGKGTIEIGWLIYSSIFTIVLMVIGILVFNKVENRFIDTV
jgi:lipopolysaccharide transport system permease protein